MLVYINGRIIAKIEDSVIIKIPSGVGYLVNVSSKNDYMVNENVEMFLFEVLRETKVELFGFRNLEERKWCEKLMKVSGVGPKSAATIIYDLGIEKINQALAESSPKIFSEVKGLGLKTAKKIVLELKGAQTDLEKIQKVNINLNSEFTVDFVDTLSGLGYKRGEIVSLITKMKKNKVWIEKDLIETVKNALQLIG
jgi:holliday junction DNA helicase RuvA